MKKKIFVCMMCMLLVIGMSGCEKRKQWIFSLHGEKLYDKDVMAFGIVYGSEHNIANSEQLNEIYEGKKTYQEYYKEQFSESVIETTILYAEAKQKGYKLSKEAEQEVYDSADALVEKYSEKWLEIKNLTKDDIVEVYKKEALGELYIEKEMQTEGEKKGNSKDEGTERYVRIFQVTFPTVKLDDEGMVISNSNGEMENVSEEEKEKRKQEAESFAESAKAGGDLTELLKEYDSKVTGVERILKYADLDEAYKKAVDEIDEKEISSVIESDYGYYVIELLESDDNSHAQKLAGYKEDVVFDEVKSDIINRLLDVYAKEEKEYRNREKWDEISFVSFLK